MTNAERNEVIEECARKSDAIADLYSAYACQEGRPQRDREMMAEHAMTCRDVSKAIRSLKRDDETKAA